MRVPPVVDESGKPKLLHSLTQNALIPCDPALLALPCHLHAGGPTVPLWRTCSKVSSLEEPHFRPRTPSPFSSHSQFTIAIVFEILYRPHNAPLRWSTSSVDSRRLTRSFRISRARTTSAEFPSGCLVNLVKVRIRRTDFITHIPPWQSTSIFKNHVVESQAITQAFPNMPQFACLA
jgi:hypothetical protein